MPYANFRLKSPYTYYKKVFMTEKIRITKLLSERKICSRREAEKFIDQGLILLNGETVTEQGTKAFRSDSLEIKQIAQSAQDQKVTIMLNKPLGIVSNLPEPGYIEASSLITEENHWEKDRRPFNSFAGQLNVAGRLDVNSKGLLLLTQDGCVAKAVIGPTSNIEKEYILRYEGELTDENLSILREGLFLDGRKLKKAIVEKHSENVLCFILKEGKKRQLRRMCEMIHLKVTSLKRVRIGSLQLGNLPVGKWRFVDRSELM
jgi:23S rRNA pseudouridine2604 synthase